jgi:hypothetical protein
MLEIFNSKFKINLKEKVWAWQWANSFTFRFISSFQLKISTHDNPMVNLEFYIEYARALNSLAFSQFIP